MAEEDKGKPSQNGEGDGGEGGSGKDPSEIKPPSKEDMESLVAERVEAALKPIKDNLENAYKARDEALSKAKAYEKEKRDAELKRLNEEGKHKEAYEMQLKEERERREATEKRNIELTRDLDLRNALSGFEFRNERSSNMAFRELVTDLVQDDKGQWVHKTGVSIKDAVKAFVGQEDNSFLLKPKINSGGGGESPRLPSEPHAGKSLFGLPQEEVIRMAREGKLRRSGPL
jgi:hypothetical protein